MSNEVEKRTFPDEATRIRHFEPGKQYGYWLCDGLLRRVGRDIDGRVWADKPPFYGSGTLDQHSWRGTPGWQPSNAKGEVLPWSVLDTPKAAAAPAAASAASEDFRAGLPTREQIEAHYEPGKPYGYWRRKLDGRPFRLGWHDGNAVYDCTPWRSSDRLMPASPSCHASAWQPANSASSQRVVELKLVSRATLPDAPSAPATQQRFRLASSVPPSRSHPAYLPAVHPAP